MARFTHHEPCPKCGSRDNLARYDDGSGWCFGCRHREPPTGYRNVVTELKIPKILPDDLGCNYTPEVVNWCAMAGVTVPELIFRNVVFSPKRQQLIYIWRQDDGKVALWQARNFSKESKARYFTSDNTDTHLPIYPCSMGRFTSGRNLYTREGRPRTIMLTEDALSAIKIGRWCDSMPCLGSGISKDKLAALRPFYDVLGVWLDDDKFKEAVNLSNLAKILGFKSTAMYTKDDPKYQSDDLIKSRLDLLEGTL